MLPVSAYFDGSYVAPPTGIACGGWVVQAQPDATGLEQDMTGRRRYGADTVDVAATEHSDPVAATECAAALDALQAIAHTGYRGRVVLYGDNEQLAREFMDQRRPGPATVIGNLDALRHATTAFASVEMIWVPREENDVAHRLARRALYDALIDRYSGRVEEFRLVRTRSGVYIHRYIVFPTPPVALEAAGPIAEERVLDAGQPRAGWHTIDLAWGGLKADASQRAKTDKTVLSIVTPAGMIAGSEAESRGRQAPPWETQNANDHWHRHVVRDTMDVDAASGL